QTRYALGWSTLHSLWQAAILYNILCLGMLCAPTITAKIKYNLAMGIQMVIFLNFIIAYIYFFQQYTAQIAFTEVSVQTITANFLSSQQSSFSLAPIFPYLVAGYLLGFVIQLLVLSKGLLNLRKLRYKGLFCTPAHWTPIL